jgi:ABC-type oligopeptide transport system substrate-binding subunit
MQKTSKFFTVFAAAVLFLSLAALSTCKEKESEDRKSVV